MDELIQRLATVTCEEVYTEEGFTELERFIYDDNIKFV